LTDINTGNIFLEYNIMNISSIISSKAHITHLCKTWLSLHVCGGCMMWTNSFISHVLLSNWHMHPNSS